MKRGKKPARPIGIGILFWLGAGDILPSPLIKVYIKLDMSFRSSFLSNPIQRYSLFISYNNQHLVVMSPGGNVPPTFDCLREEGRLLFIVGFAGTEAVPSESSADKCDSVVRLCASLLLFMPEGSSTAGR